MGIAHTLSKSQAHRAISAALIISLSIAQGGCAKAPTTPAPPEQRLDLPSGGIDLYLSRAHLGGAEFEYYHIDGNQLLVECGKILGGRRTSLSREILSLDEGERSVLAATLGAAQEKSFSEAAKFKTPGETAHLADPGEFRVSYDDEHGTHRIASSLDSITRATHEREKKVKALAEQIRTLARGNTCGNRSFFGIGTHDS